MDMATRSASVLRSVSFVSIGVVRVEDDSNTRSGSGVDRL
jgi:hypothetical protein